MNDGVQVIELLVMGWIMGMMTCLLYASIADYVRAKRRNRVHRELLNAGMDPLEILRLGL